MVHIRIQSYSKDDKRSQKGTYYEVCRLGMAASRRRGGRGVFPFTEGRC